MKWLIAIGVLLPMHINAGKPGMVDVIQKVNPKVDRVKATEFARSIKQYSAVFNVDPNLIAAVIAVESAFNDKAVGKSHGEIGLMQLRPEFHMTKIKSLKLRKKMLFDVDHNIGTGVRYISGLKEVFGSTYKNNKFIELYNMGPNRKPKKFKYTAKVMRMYKQFGGKIDRQVSKAY